MKILPPLTLRADPHCRLCQAWRQVGEHGTICVASRGNGPDGGFPSRCDIMFVGQSPGRDENEQGKCLAPETLILKADLTWVPLDDIQVGDVLWAFDEFGLPRPKDNRSVSKSSGRRWRLSTVVARKESERPIRRIGLSDGTELIGTGDHKVLAGSSPHNKHWRRLDRLALGTKRQSSLMSLVDVWESDETYNRGWIAGFFDGDGTLALKKGHGPTAMFTQNIGLTEEEAAQRLKAEGFNLGIFSRGTRYKSGHTCRTYSIKGGWRETLRFLGSIRPNRLLRKLFENSKNITPEIRAKRVKVVSRDLYPGVHRVIDIQTTTGTFIANGLAVHNCFVGRSGLIFNGFVKSYLGKRYGWVATNATRCHLGFKSNSEVITPWVGKPNEPGPMTACRVHLVREIQRLRPKWIVPMGAFAIAQVLGLPVNQVKVKKMLCVPMNTQWPGIKSFALNHPAAMARLGIDKHGKGKGVDKWERQWNGLMDAVKGKVNVLPGEWRFIDDEAELSEWYRKHLFKGQGRAGFRVAFDYETTGLNPRTDLFRLVGYGFRESAIVHRLRTPVELDLHQRFLEQCPKVILHNFGFELYWSYIKMGLMPKGLMIDTKILGFLVDENRSLSLVDLVDEYLPAFSGFKHATESLESGVVGAPIHLLAERCAYDCMATYRLADLLQKKLTPKQINFYISVVEPALRSLVMCRIRGWKVDRERLDALRLSNLSDLEGLESKVNGIEEIAGWIRYSRQGKGINLNSRMDVPDLLKHLGVPEFSTEMQPNDPLRMRTNKDTLIPLKHKHPVVGQILDYKAVRHLRSQFILPMLKNSDNEEGMLYPGYNWGGRASQDKASGTITGRPSCSNPNLMNLPARTDKGMEIRKCIVSRFEGGMILNADLAQAELRIMAMLAGEDAMLDVFREGGDPHQLTADRIGRPRVVAKEVNFAVSYGSTAERLAKVIECPVDEAREVLTEFWFAYPKLQTYFDMEKLQALKRGWVEGPFGMRMRCPDVHSLSPQKAAHALRSVANWKVQHIGSGILVLRAMGRYEVEQDPAWKSVLFGTLYDGLYVDLHPDDDPEPIKDLLRQVMVEEPMRIYDWLTVPLEVDFKITETMGG